MLNVSYAGCYDNGYGASKVRNHALTLTNKLEKIMEYSQRFRRVMVENLDYRECIEKYDGRETLFYCDPPYYGTRAMDWSKIQWKNLRNTLDGVEGKAMVSSYKCEEMDEIFDGWGCITLDRARNIDNVEDDDRVFVEEALYVNWKVPEQKVL